VLSREATNTNFKVFGLTGPGLERMIYCIRGEHAKHYATDVVTNSSLIPKHKAAELFICRLGTGDRLQLQHL
jgi:hypothetical protein